jgi:AraC family transcriptional regulator, regulatory protein of adaptative response / methylphosphotriester-DNA alkyltransferase methyltransferase
MELPKKIAARQHEITSDYLAALDTHLLDIVEGRATGLHPCHFYEEKIMAIAKAMLKKNEQSISAIANLLTYDPSNFTNSSNASSTKLQNNTAKPI